MASSLVGFRLNFRVSVLILTLLLLKLGLAECRLLVLPIPSPTRQAVAEPLWQAPCEGIFNDRACYLTLRLVR